MTNELTYEQETVRSVFGAYINDLKAYSSKPNRPMFRRLEEVRDKAIKALEQQSCEDCISRDAVIRLVEQYPHIIGNRYSGLTSDIKRLPPVQPQRKKGKWIEIEDNSDEYHFECSECGQRMNWVDENDNYCCCCGAFMNPDGEG